MKRIPCSSLLVSHPNAFLASSKETCPRVARKVRVFDDECLMKSPCSRQPSQPCRDTRGGTETLPKETECWQLLARSTSSRGRYLGRKSAERQTQGKVQCFFPPAQSQSAGSKRPSRLNCCKCWWAFQDSERMRMRAPAPYSEEGHCGAEVASVPAEQHPATRVFGLYCFLCRRLGNKVFPPSESSIWRA